MLYIKLKSQSDDWSINTSSTKELSAHILTVVNDKNVVFREKPVILSKFKLKSL